MFCFVFVSIQSLFGVIWALQPVYSTVKVSFLLSVFFFFLSFYATFLID